jgi:hypothetical protein
MEQEKMSNSKNSGRRNYKSAICNVTKAAAARSILMKIARLRAVSGFL